MRLLGARGIDMASKKLVRLATAAARAGAKAAAAQRAWAEQFEAEYGHGDISDALVDVVEAAHLDDLITAEFIDQHSAAEQS